MDLQHLGLVPDSNKAEELTHQTPSEDAAATVGSWSLPGSKTGAHRTDPPLQEGIHSLRTPDDPRTRRLFSIKALACWYLWSSDAHFWSLLNRSTCWSSLLLYWERWPYPRKYLWFTQRLPQSMQTAQQQHHKEQDNDGALAPTGVGHRMSLAVWASNKQTKSPPQHYSKSNP